MPRLLKGSFITDYFIPSQYMLMRHFLSNLSHHLTVLVNLGLISTVIKK